MIDLGLTDEPTFRVCFMIDRHFSYFSLSENSYLLRILFTSVNISFHEENYLLLLSGKNKLKALYLFTHRCCSRFTYSGAWFSVSNCKHYKICLY